MIKTLPRIAIIMIVSDRQESERGHSRSWAPRLQTGKDQGQEYRLVRLRGRSQEISEHRSVSIRDVLSSFLLYNNVNDLFSRAFIFIDISNILFRNLYLCIVKFLVIYVSLLTYLLYCIYIKIFD